MSSYTMSSTLVFTKMNIELSSSPLDGDDGDCGRKYRIHYHKYYHYFKVYFFINIDKFVFITYSTYWI